MKILQINNCHYRRGGADIVYLNTSELLKKKGHQVLNFSQQNNNNQDDSGNEYFVKQIDFFKISPIEKLLKTPRFFYSIEAKLNLENLIKREKPDIAHIHLYKGVLTPSILLALKRSHIPVVITIHDYGLLCPHNLFLDGKNQICIRCLSTNNPINCIINKCNHNNLVLSTVSALEFIFHKVFFPFSEFFDRIIVVSKFGMEIHSRKVDLKNKITHLYNFYPESNTTKHNTNKGDYFLYFGRLSPEKGILSLLYAWKELKSDAKLKIAGDGPLMTDVKEFIMLNNLTNIEILGFKMGDELNELINHSSFVIVPSECYENNPLTIIEAYSNGKPVIGSKLGGIPEIIVNNETGYLYEIGNIKNFTDVLQKASSISLADYQLMSQKSRLFAKENFSEEIHYDNLIKIYKSVVYERKTSV